MEKIQVVKLNNSECKLICSPSVFNELSDLFSFYIQGAKFHPKVKAKKWDGKIRLINNKKKTIPYGLLSRLKKYCSLNNYEFESDIDFSDNDFTIEEAQAFVSGLNLPFSIRDYQLNAVVHAIKKQRSIVISPTGCLDPETEIEIEILEKDLEKIKKLISD